jgi:hypothetical protein
LRVIVSKDNITTWYGRTGESRIADLANPSHIFSWLICQSHDDKGNVVISTARDGSNAWHFEVDFDYGEHDANAPTERWFNSFKNERVHGERHTPAFAPRQ